MLERLDFMAGLEQITATILDDARTEAEAILLEGRKKSQLLLEEARTQANKRSEKAADEASRKAASIRRAAESAGALAGKNLLLSTRTKLIETAFAQSLDTLRRLPGAEYFQVLSRLILANALEGEGSLILSPRDLGRLPQDFLASVNAALSTGKNISLASESDNSLNGGCVLRYGDILLNCSFEALLESEREPLTDLVNQVLFN